jgi:hypothetical protein
MANTNAPFGLKPVGHLLAGWKGQGRTYYIPSTDVNAFAMGDPVVLAGGADSAGVATVTLATAGTTNLVVGAIMGMAGGKVYGGAIGVNPLGNQDALIIPATKTVGYYVEVADDPFTIFHVMEDYAGTPWTAAEVGLNASLKSGTNNGFISGWVLDNGTEATTSALQMKLLGLAQLPNNVYGIGAIWNCVINNHCYKASSAGT